DAAGVGLEQAADDVEQRGLAGAVRADDRDDLALPDRDGHVLDRAHPAEALRHAGDGELRLLDGGLGGVRGARHHSRGPIPCGCGMAGMMETRAGESNRAMMTGVDPPLFAGSLRPDRTPPLLPSRRAA